MTFRRGRGAVNVSLFVQVLALMAGAQIFGLITYALVFFYAPAPVPETHGVSEIVNTYFGEPPRNEKGKPRLVLKKTREPVIENQTPMEEYRRGVRGAIARGIESRTPDRDVLGRNIRIRSAAPRWVSERQIIRDGLQSSEAFFIIAPFTVAIPEDDGSWTEISTAPGIRIEPWQLRLMITGAVTSIVILIATYLFAQRLTQPFKRLAESAERLGRDPGAPLLSVTGPSEARVAAGAFNQMQERLKRYVADRTEMIGAIAHDLRTPLTRLRFRVESAPEDQRAKMQADLDQMEAMISATLSFVRDATHRDERTRLELSSLLESLVHEMSDTGSEASVERADKVVVEADPVALKRLFGNLLDNAVKYGKRARVRVFRTDDHAVVEIDDDGPGIPERDLDRVFEPFYRQERSRNRDTGGIGLGLAVVRTVARAHGGDAELINRQGGGLTARVRLPA